MGHGARCADHAYTGQPPLALTEVLPSNHNKPHDQDLLVQMGDNVAVAVDDHAGAVADGQGRPGSQ
jgi:hypothetical protein